MSPKKNKYINITNNLHDKYNDKNDITACNLFISKIMMYLIGKKPLHLSHNMRLI